MFYAVIDTNVLVAAMLTHHDDSPTLRIVKGVFLGSVVPVVTDGIITEYLEVLSRPKFDLSQDEANSLVNVILTKALWAAPRHYCGKMIDEKDRVFYEVALAVNSFGGKLVTGNERHFPNTPMVLSPSQFCDIAEI